MRQSVISAGRTEANFRFAPALRRFIEAIFAAGAFLTLTGKLSGFSGWLATGAPEPG
jgi:hypothetical protein